MKIKFFILIIISFLLGCASDEQETKVEEDSPPFKADIVGSWKVDSLVTASTCDEVTTGSVSSYYLNISAESDGQLYDNGVHLENVTYTDRYRYDGPFEGEGNTSFYLSVGFVDNDRGEGYSIYSRFTIESSFSSFVEVISCSVFRSVDFTRQ